MKAAHFGEDGDLRHWGPSLATRGGKTPEMLALYPIPGCSRFVGRENLVKRDDLVGVEICRFCTLFLRCFLRTSGILCWGT